MHQKINSLTLKNGELTNEANRLTQELEAKIQAEDEARAEIAKLKNETISKKGADDWELEKELSGLHGKILRFVLMHCRNHSNKYGVYGALPLVAKDWYVMEIISDHLHRHAFVPEQMSFGFGSPWDETLSRLETELQKTGMGNRPQHRNPET
jgi:hypothetical protein